MFQLPEGEYCMYLRKSRADLEAEARGEGETLAKHERHLLALAQRYNINITEIYREVVSGERISERPKVIQLLEEVERGRWQGVLVMEVERLARGDTIDQGIVARAFKMTDTLIVTPVKIYDPNNEFDEEYFEFGLFMSRREYKTINRRLQRGRIDSVKEGNFLGSLPPYGYEKVKLDDGGFSLAPHPDQAPVVRQIFDWYTQGLGDPPKRVGTALIARQLNDMQIPTAKSSKWIVATVNGILRNPVYIGKIRWNSRPTKKNRSAGQAERPRAPQKDWILVEGKHPALISEETFNLAQEILSTKYHVPVPYGKVSNPLAGLIRCDVCGRMMILRPHYGKIPDMLMCQLPSCSNIASYLHLVEERVISGLQDWLKEYKALWKAKRPKAPRQDNDIVRMHELAIAALKKELKELDEQKGEVHKLLEKKVYTIEVFLERSQFIAGQIEEKTKALQLAEEVKQTEIKRAEARIEIIPKVEHVLKSYHKAKDPAEKNHLLKTVLERATYRKDYGGRWSGAVDKFTLVLYPKFSKIESADHR